MGWVPDAYLDLSLIAIAAADQEAICSEEPMTFFNACWPNLWTASATYQAGDVVRAPTDAGFVYECTVGGAAGSSEPPWGDTQDETFADGAVTWKTHENYSLINSDLVSGDKVIGDRTEGGRQLVVAQKENVLIHRSGNVAFVALITKATKALHYVNASETVDEASDAVVSGRTAILYALTVPSYVGS
jgi:hypothetical protein